MMWSRRSACGKTVRATVSKSSNALRAGGERVTYTALLWMEEEEGAGRRALVRDISFPWVHHESADSALEHAIGTLEARLNRVTVPDVA
jgi:hypothetical protein